ncbi:MAG: hypothetical protein K8S94_14215 [Planctomycetia bacterium]|nr:hypothetical protein [Planctomycetia bacterium]
MTDAGAWTMHDSILAAQAVASGAMCGLIWFVQVVHYPLFVATTGDPSADYAAENQRRTSWVVLPFMLVEMATAALIVIAPPPGVGRGTAVVGMVLVIAIWASTLLVQMPLHARLARDGHRPPLVDALVRGNWFRTLAWTVRAILAVWMLRVAG